MATYLHIAALAALDHAETHGDVSLCQRLYQEVARTNLTNGKNVKDWFARFGPLTARQGVWCLKEGWRKDQFDLDRAAITPIVTRGVAIDFKNVLAPNSWRKCAGRLQELSHIEILAIQQACNESLLIGGSNAIAHRMREAIEAEWRRRIAGGDFFRWPKLYILPGNKHLTSIESPALGMLGALGYRVGKVQGQPEKVRQGTLEYIYCTEVLPPLNSPAYVEKWSTPKSDARLKTMAYGIAHASWIAQSRIVQDLRVAISQWSSDLEYLRSRYYRGRFKFPPKEKKNG